MQSVAFDFILKGDEIKILEMSYYWSLESFGKHPGYWLRSGEWVEGSFWPSDFIIEDLLNNKS